MNLSNPTDTPPAKRRRHNWIYAKENIPPTNQASVQPAAGPLHIPFSPVTPSTSHSNADTPPPRPSASQQTPSTQKKKNRPNMRNGYQVQPKPTPYRAYAHPSPSNSQRTPLAPLGIDPIAPVSELDAQQWNALAQTAGVLAANEHLRPFQIEVANRVLGRSGDVCVISPTGSGKSLVWVLPLLARTTGISLVVVPYTSLGHQGETRYLHTGIKSHFVHSKNKAPALLREIAGGGAMRIVYVCAEMLETPSMATLLYSDSFKAQLSAVYIDEAHTPHESQHWRPAYSRLHQLRRISGLVNVPMVALSATLPALYRHTLTTSAGLNPNYHLINLGNARPELAVIIKPLQYDISSFRDLEFLFPPDGNPSSIPQTIVYSDDIERITAAFWWCKDGLHARGIVDSGFVDLVHAGLSSVHQSLATTDFMKGKTSILFATDKIGAGMDFPHVSRVVQYCCRDLTLVQWEQRRGRGGRKTGGSAVGILLVEKSMATGEEGSPSLSQPGFEDPGLLDAIHSDTTCYDIVAGRWLENPDRNVKPCQTRCSRCNPSLLFSIRTLTWITHTPASLPITPAPRATSSMLTTPSPKQQEDIVAKLTAWRFKYWSDEWKNKWLRSGPKHLVCDADLEVVSKLIHQIDTTDTLYKKLHIAHFSIIAPELLKAIEGIQTEMYGNTVLQLQQRQLQEAQQIAQVPADALAPHPAPQSMQYQSIRWANEQPTMASAPRQNRKRSYRDLGEGEIVWNANG